MVESNRWVYCFIMQLEVRRSDRQREVEMKRVNEKECLSKRDIGEGSRRSALNIGHGLKIFNSENGTYL